MLATFILVACVLITGGLWVKEMENPGLYQGDIFLDPEERAALRNYAFGSTVGKRWPGAILPYVIDPGLSNSVKKTIPLAIKEYEKYTCLRFRKRTYEDSYLRFYSGGGCASSVGYKKGRVHKVSLSGGCWRLGTVLHEIGHAIGLWHEQSRPDRDQYVEILWKNIDTIMHFNFEKKNYSEVDSLGTPYDYLSMMHYKRRAFGGGSLTIVTKDPAYQKLIGEGNGFSEIDKLQINLMYCNGTTKIPTLPPLTPPTTPGCADKPGMPCEHWKKTGYCAQYESIRKLCCKTC